MKTLVMKFGGAAVASPENFSLIADIILARHKLYQKIAVVVSAMGDTTDQLIELAKKVNPSPPRREYDMLVTVGERISISLLAMALARKGRQAFSFTGSQSGIITCSRHSDARIINVRPHRILPHLNEGRIVIVAGFQGVSKLGEITTLGRGGSDTSAVALAAAIGAEKVEFYKDVPGVFPEDPKRAAGGSLYPQLTYDQALAIVNKGAQVLHPRCIELAKRNALPLQVRSFTDFAADRDQGTWIFDQNLSGQSVAIFEDETEETARESCFANIAASFDVPGENNVRYKEIIGRTLRKILPDYLFNLHGHAFARPLQQKQLHSLLPLVAFVPCQQVPGNLSFYSLSFYRRNSFKFFYEMISGWLIPGKRLNVVLIHAADFRFPDLSDQVYTLSEVMVHVEDPLDLQQIRKNFPIIQAEVSLGLQSSYNARRILEVKGLTADEKTSMIQEYITFLMDRLPKAFDKDVLTEMQHVLVMCRDEFKSGRDSRHLSKIICVHYLFRKALQEAVKAAPDKRHLSLKLFKTKLKVNNGSRPVLGVVVGVNFLRDKEVFEKKHVLGAIQNYIPNVQLVEGSYFSNRRGGELIDTLYLEVEKVGKGGFTQAEILTLNSALPNDLKDRVEYPMHPVFMPRNEEEIMRNILSLSNQIKFLRDIPQVIITFDEQTHTHLFFTVIVVRVMKPGSSSIQDLFQDVSTMLEYIHDRSKMVGFLRKKYTKEATVFRAKLSKDPFLRKDHSIDLFQARQMVVTELSRILGEFRDFNGGMIAKQNELLVSLSKLLGPAEKPDELLLQNFFFSLQPVAMRAILEPEALKTLFLMLRDAIQISLASGESLHKIRKDDDFVFVLIKGAYPAIKEEVEKGLDNLSLQSTEFAWTYVRVYDVPYLGYIYRCNNLAKQQSFCQIIQNILSTGCSQLA